METVIRAPRGAALRCKGWKQEAALRMLMNNLDPEVAERPQDLIVYGGAGKAARNWECFRVTGRPHASFITRGAIGTVVTLFLSSGAPEPAQLGGISVTLKRKSP